MQLVIKDKTFNVKFGVRFVRELDKAFPNEQNGMKFGMALATKIPELLGFDIAALSDIIYFGTVTESPRPSQVDVDEYIENVEDIEKLFENVLDELRESNSGKLFMNQIDKEVKN